MNITTKGKKWDIYNSLWILWSFTLVLACVGFFWIGGRAGKRKWIISGLIYLIVNFGLIYIAIWLQSINAIYSNIITVIIGFGWFAAIVQSFMSRKEYLLRREAVIDLKDVTKDAYRNEIRKDYFGNNEKSVGQSPLPAMAQNTSEPQMPTLKIDLNIASEQDLARLPGIGVASAKRAVEMRTQTVDFTSVQNFCEQLNLMPHFAIQIENLAFVTPIKSQTSPPENKGRVVDI